MVILYFIVIKLYAAAITVAALFNKKAALWVKGRQHWRNKLQSELKPGEKRILFHCASLGEFEQGKPLLEELKVNYPQHKIVLTFFSPSGYEVRKNEPLADYVFYLPVDGPLNARHFVELVNPNMAFFVKYEFWHFFIKELRAKKIPVYFISAIFRPTQIYFQPFGKFFFGILKRVSHFFVQNQPSLELLYRNGITPVSVTGDTRFDRVFQNSLHAKSIPEIEQFKGKGKLLVAGSTWAADEKILQGLIGELEEEYKVVIVPHEISPSHIESLLSKFGSTAVKFSEFSNASSSKKIMIVDNIGMLSSIYKHANVAYVGGGFGSGIHNILEPVVFGIPVFIGPNYKKFREASELVHWKGVFSIRNENELLNRFLEVMNDAPRIEKIKEINNNYISNNKGSTDLIISFLKINEIS